jgi:hypothetical protein
MKLINKSKIAAGIATLIFGATALAGPTNSVNATGYVNNYDRVDLLNRTFTKPDGSVEPLESMHVVIKDLNGPSLDVIATCNMTLGVENTKRNRLDYSLEYEHSFRAFVYANTDLELEENLVAVFMTSPGRFGVHAEYSGLRTLGSFTDQGDWNVLDHNSGILAGEKFGQLITPEKKVSVFDLYRSKASEGAPMYNAIFFKRGTALHGSDGKVDGNPRSHACVRFRREEGVLNQKLAIAVDGNVKVSVRDTEVFKDCYDKETVRKARDYQNFIEEAKKNFDKTPAQRQFDAMSSGGLY